MPKGVYVRNPNIRIGRKTPLTPQQDQEIAKLYLAGHSLSQIGRQFHLVPKAIRKALIRTGTARRPQHVAGYGKDNPAWRGGWRKDEDGYVLVRCPDHPQARNGYVREHRLVMEQYLGRALLPSEVVHHKNGRKDDNRIDNLELFPTNAEHLAHELAGRVPKWTEDGRARMKQAHEQWCERQRSLRHTRTDDRQ